MEYLQVGKKVAWKAEKKAAKKVGWRAAP